MKCHSRDFFRKKLQHLIRNTLLRAGLRTSRLLLALLALGVVTASMRAQTPIRTDNLALADGKTSTARTSLNFKLYRGYLIMVEGSVGELKNLHFIVDTSSSPSIADRRLVAKLGILQQSESVSVPGGIVGAGRAVLRDVRVGPLSARSLPVLSLDLSYLGKELGINVDMLLGLDLLGQSSFSIDYRARSIFFGQPPSLPLALPMESEPPLVFVTVMLDGRPSRLLVNTGFPDLMLEGTGGERIQNVNIDQTRLAMNAAGSEVVCKRGTVRSVRLGAMDLGEQPAVFVNRSSKELDGSLPITARFKEVAFDFKHQVLGIRR